MLEFLFTAFGVLFASIAGIVFLPKFPEWMHRLHLKQNERGRQRLLRMVADRDGKFESSVKRPLVGNHYHFGRLWGVLRANELSAPVVGDIHGKLRSSYGLYEFSLQYPVGVLSVNRVNSSYDEMRQVIVEQFEAGRFRGLSKFALWCIIISSAFALLAVAV